MQNTTPPLRLGEGFEDVEAAVADVDLSLLDWFATLSPLERLQFVSRQTRILWETRGSNHHPLGDYDALQDHCSVMNVAGKSVLVIDVDTPRQQAKGSAGPSYSSCSQDSQGW